MAFEKIEEENSRKDFRRLTDHIEKLFKEYWDQKEGLGPRTIHAAAEERCILWEEEFRRKRDVLLSALEFVLSSVILNTTQKENRLKVLEVVTKSVKKFITEIDSVDE